MRTAVLCLLSLAGCDRVFGLSRDEPDAPVDGPPVMITGKIVRRFMHNNAALEPVADAVPYAASELVPRALIGGAETTVDWNAATGTFSFTGQGGTTYRLLLKGNEYQATATHLELDELAPTRRDAVPTPDNLTSVTLDVTPLPVTSVQFTTTGVWSDSVPMASLTGAAGSFTLNWRQASFTDGRSVMLDAAANDALYYVEREMTTDVPPILAVTRTALALLTMTAGANPVAVASTALARPYCVTFDARRGDELLRLKANSHVVSSALGVYSVPRLDLGVAVAIALAIEYSRDNVVLPMMYGTPFPGQDTFVGMQTTAARDLRGTSLVYGTIYSDQITNQTACVPIAFPGGAELPIAIKLANVELKTDDLVVGLPPTLTELTWNLSPGTTTPDRYVVQLGIVNGTNPVPFIRAYVTTERRLVIDPAVFEEGTTYVVRITTQTGFPMARTGDFTVRTLPSKTGFADSAAFRVSR